MLRELALIVVAGAIAVVAAFALLHPFDPTIHSWGAALAVALAGLALVWAAVFGVGARQRSRRWVAVASLGGIVMAVAYLWAELAVGPPQRVLAAPAQTYRPPGSTRLSIDFPAIGPGDLSGGRPASVVVRHGEQAQELAAGSQMRIGSYVLRADSWPAASVVARSLTGEAQTITQPSGAVFVSPVLQFPGADPDGLLTDSFAVPALHREVRVKYYPGLPSRGINIPFLQLQIEEENGGALFDGVAVSGRPLKHAGMELLFDLGTYPVVSMVGAPDTFAFGIGLAVALAGVLGFVASVGAQRRVMA